MASVNPSQRDEYKLYQMLCCAITLYYSLVLSCHTKWCVKDPACKSLRGVPEPLGTPLPTPLNLAWKCYSCNMGTWDLPDIFAHNPRALAIHIRQIPCAHVTTTTVCIIMWILLADMLIQMCT